MFSIGKQLISLHEQSLSLEITRYPYVTADLALLYLALNPSSVVHIHSSIFSCNYSCRLNNDELEINRFGDSSTKKIPTTLLPHLYHTTSWITINNDANYEPKPPRNLDFKTHTDGVFRKARRNRTIKKLLVNLCNLHLQIDKSIPTYLTLPTLKYHPSLSVYRSDGGNFFYEYRFNSNTYKLKYKRYAGNNKVYVACTRAYYPLSPTRHYYIYSDYFIALKKKLGEGRLVFDVDDLF